MVEQKPSKLTTRVRFPSPAPRAACPGDRRAWSAGAQRRATGRHAGDCSGPALVLCNGRQGDQIRLGKTRRQGIARQEACARDGRANYAEYRLRARRRGRYRQRLSRPAAVHSRPLRDHVRRAPVDHPPVRRLLDRRRIQRLLPPQPRRGAEGALRRLRPRHPPRLRQRQSARRWGRGHGGRRHRHRRGHEIAVRRHPARSRCRSA